MRDFFNTLVRYRDHSRRADPGVLSPSDALGERSGFPQAFARLALNFGL